MGRRHVARPAVCEARPRRLVEDGRHQAHKDRRLTLDPATIALLSAQLVLLEETAQSAGVTVVPYPYVLTSDGRGAARPL